MSIGFKQIPGNIRVPLFYAEVDPSRANTAQLNQRALIIAQITSSGAAVPNVPIISQGTSDAITQGGAGSQLALMTAAYRANDNFGEVWYLPVSDAAGSTAATDTITIGTVPTVNGTIPLYVAGTLVSCPVTTAQTTAQIATALAAAITATPNLPVTATASTNVVTVTAINKGLAGNDIDLRLAYRGALGGEALPAGLTITIATPQLTGGATNPTLTTALANLLDMPFDFIITPWNDTTTLAALQTLLNDSTGRWSWNRQIYGHVFAAYRGTLSACTTLGLARNNQHETILGFNDSPSPNWLWAAALGAAVAVSVRADPGLPLQTVVLQGILAPPLASRFDLPSRNTLLFDGISTFNVGQDGTIFLEKIITTYQLNAFGQPDNSYLGIETMFLLMYVLRDLASLVTTKYARMKLAANGTRVLPGSNVVTPNIIRAELIARYKALEARGVVQNSAAFAQNLIVQQNATNPNRVDVLWPAILINQLNIFAVLAQFRLQ